MVQLKNPMVQLKEPYGAVERTLLCSLENPMAQLREPYGEVEKTLWCS